MAELREDVTDIKRILLQKSTTDRLLLDSVTQGKRSFADSVAQGKRSFADSVKSGNSREPVLLKVDFPHPTRKHSAETITAIPAPTCDGEYGGELPRPDVRMLSDWKTVKRKREVIKGQKTVTGMFKIAARSADLYVGRCDKSVTKDTIKKFCVEEIKVPLLACQCISRDIHWDFNADPNKGAFWPLLNEFIESNSFIINDFNLPIDTSTYLSPAHNSTSWLDHIISTSDLNISNISIKYDISLYDHFPLCADISIPVNTGQLPSSCTLISDFIDWPKFNQA